MDAFAALGDPTRRAILDLLLEGECTAGAIGEAFPHLSQPAISRNLSILRAAGLVAVRPEAQRRVYALAASGVTDLERWLGPHRQYWIEYFEAQDQAEARAKGRTRSSPP